MFAWGRCDYGQLGLGGIEDNEVSCPRLVNELPPDTSIQDIKSGDSHAVILTTEGKILTCGSNDYEQV